MVHIGIHIEEVVLHRYQKSLQNFMMSSNDVVKDLSNQNNKKSCLVCENFALQQWCLGHGSSLCGYSYVSTFILIPKKCTCDISSGALCSDIENIVHHMVRQNKTIRLGPSDDANVIFLPDSAYIHRRSYSLEARHL